MGDRMWHDAYAERKHAEVMSETWGHLAPKTGRRYRGHILFAHGAYGDVVALECEFAGLPSSPWFFDDLQDWIFEQVRKRGGANGIWRFDGTYVQRKNGTAEFCGDVTTMVALASEGQSDAGKDT
jgi:hypothetical protein